MTTRSLEDAFARFRDERDLAALAEVFDRTAPELLEVARHLARRRGEAEDLVQATFLAALERAERFEEGRALVPWLLGILVNLARRARERRGAVGEPSAQLADTRAPDPAARAAESEFHLALEGALARLPLTYREVLASHLGEGHAPEEIARRLGRAPGTVRVQLHRGFAHLRRLLPAGFALGVLGLLSSRGLAAVRAEVLRAASGRRAPLATTLTIGGGLMGKKLALVALVLLGAGSAWWFASRGERAEPAATVAAATTATELAAPPRIEVASAEPAPNRVAVVETSAGTESASSEPYGALTVVLSWWDGTPAQGLELQFIPYGERQPCQAYQLRVTDSAGRASVARIHEGEVHVKIERMGWDGASMTRVVRAQEQEEHLTLARNVDVLGRVLDPGGAPVAGAQLWVKRDLVMPAHPVERSQADGSFRVRSMPEGFGLLATAAGQGSSDTAEWQALEALGEDTRRVELELRGESAGIAGLVRDENGASVSGARISVFCANDQSGRELRRWPYVRFAADEDGAFRLDGLHRGHAQLLVVAPGLAAKTEQLELEEGRLTHVVIALDPGFTVRGTVARADGRPLIDARILANAAPSLFVALGEFGELWTTVDRDGSYALEHVPAGSAVIVAFDGDPERGPRAQRIFEAHAGETRTWDVSFGSGAVLRGRARDERGSPLAGWWVRAMPAPGTGAAMSADVPTGEDGSFVLPDLADSPFNVFLYAPDDERHERLRAMERLVSPGGSDIVLVVRGEREPSAFLLARVLSPGGEPVRPKRVSARRADEMGSIGEPEWLEGERFRLGPMLSGEYELSLSVEGFPGVRREFSVAEGETLELGDLPLARTGRARLTLRPPDGATPGKLSAFLMEAGRYASRLTSEDGLVFESEPLFPGTYSLRILSGTAAPDHLVSIEILPGETTEQELALVAARKVHLEFELPQGSPLPRRARVELRDDTGAVYLDVDAQHSKASDGSHESLGLSAALPFGRFDYSVRSADGWSAAGAIEIQPGDDATLRIPISLSR